MNSKDLTVAALSSGTTDSATERYTIMRGSTLGRLTPIEYETIMNPTVSLAA